MPSQNVLTERTYEFAFVQEILDNCRGFSGGLVIPPYFPNTREENKVGYDVCLEIATIPMFFQLKLSRKIVGKNARECRSGLVSPPYYRFKIYSRLTSPQHRLLIDLENYLQQTGGLGVVQYAAPLFDRWEEFFINYSDGKIREESFYVSPLSIGEITDDEDHTYYYKPEGPAGLHSQHRELTPARSWGEFWAQIIMYLDREVVYSPEDYKSLLMLMIRLVREHFFIPYKGWPPWNKYNREFYRGKSKPPPDISYLIEKRDVLGAIAIVAKVFFDAAFVLAYR